MINIKIKHIFEEIAYNIAQSEMWGHDSKIAQEHIDRERYAFRARLEGVLSVIRGSNIYPIGEKLVEYKGCYLPESLIPEISKEEYWPKWYKGQI